MKVGKALLATPATDAALRKRYRGYGQAAKLAGRPREPDHCQDPTSLIASWWYEGYDAVELPSVEMKDVP